MSGYRLVEAGAGSVLRSKENSRLRMWSKQKSQKIKVLLAFLFRPLIPVFLSR